MSQENVEIGGLRSFNRRDLDRLGLALSTATVQRSPRPTDVRFALDGRRKPSPVGTADAVRAPGAHLYPDMFSLAQAHKGLNEEGRIANPSLQERFDDNVVNFMDQVEASKHYPCVKKAWVEHLGEQPEPVLDRVE